MSTTHHAHPGYRLPAAGTACPSGCYGGEVPVIYDYPSDSDRDQPAEGWEPCPDCRPPIPSMLDVADEEP